MHAFWRLHSELTTHSGRHPGGVPMYSGKHEHTACSFTVLHWLLGPQGEGWQGFFGFLAALFNERLIQNQIKLIYEISYVLQQL